MKNISILGVTAMYAVLAGSLTQTWSAISRPKQINHNPRGWQNQDLTNTAHQPVKSSYNAKQRKRKSKRHGL